ncbi:hypothetical protein TeGR_g1307 [Tetraparma gracilis]|uniref:Endoribonuclease L-PSP/chorismate mutase-like domain-containing protein n=1 Tax=Tetraparma gracilis TaxID=2962635 RepID=A0ABQ6N226_9STRA|nr:hypothetical protein TeGR_g1307 [Tetraparma gracilis]
MGGSDANYLPYKRVGDTLYLSGHLPLSNAGSLTTGRLGAGLDVPAGQAAARLCALNLLASMEEAAGGLENVRGVTKVFGLVNSADGFEEQHLVLNGCSDLLCEVLGEKGIHARSAVGVNALPLGMAVEIEAVVELEPRLGRLAVEDPRMSGVVEDGGTVYLSGQVPADAEAGIEEQVRSTLGKVDALLALAGTDKSRLVSAQIWIKSMGDFEAMNRVWNGWIDPENKPVRACVEAEMARPGILFEVMVVAKK